MMTASPPIVEFSMASDVWLVAMTVWDFAIQPYMYFGLSNEEVIKHIRDGRISREKKAVEASANSKITYFG